MQLHVNTGDGMPIYLQIANQIKHLVGARRLAPGDEIPPIRVLAQQLVVNPNTVARAYLELEREGVVVKRHGSGTYVSEQGSPLARKERVKILSQRIDSLLTEAGHLEIGDEELFKLIRERSETLRR